MYHWEKYNDNWPGPGLRKVYTTRSRPFRYVSGLAYSILGTPCPGRYGWSSLSYVPSSTFQSEGSDSQNHGLPRPCSALGEFEGPESGYMLFQIDLLETCLYALFWSCEAYAASTLSEGEIHLLNVRRGLRRTSKCPDSQLCRFGVRKEGHVVSSREFRGRHFNAKVSNPRSVLSCSVPEQRPAASPCCRFLCTHLSY